MSTQVRCSIQFYFIQYSILRGRRDDRDRRGRDDEDSDDEVLVFQKTDKPAVTGM